MDPDTDATLCRAFELLVSGTGSLALRLYAMAPPICTLAPSAFPRHLRRRFVALRDAFIMLGFWGGDHDGRPWAHLRPDEAMTLALRVLDLCFGLATRKVG